MKSWKVIAALLLMWVVVMVYMTTSLMGGGEGTAHIERQLRHAMEELDMLHAQNKELQQLAKLVQGVGKEDQEAVIQKLQERLQKATSDLERLGIKRTEQRLADDTGVETKERPEASQQSPQCQTLERETARRKVENTARELWYYINAKMNDLSTMALESPSVKNLVQEMQKSLAGFQSVMVDDFHSLRLVDGDEDWRISESKKLGDLVQKRLQFLQNPAECRKARVVVCDLKKGCGFGCQVHHAAYCLLVAYATERTLVLDSEGWRYAAGGGWESMFQPLSETCTDASGQSVHWAASSQGSSPIRVVHLPIVDALHPRPDFLPLAVPEDLAPQLKTFHGDPPVWWIGQLLRYLMRPQKHLQEDFEQSAKKMGFQKPIVGVHIRRTDKVGVEAAFHSLEEYMRHVEDYYQQLEHRTGPVTRRVYLATDDPGVLKEAREKYVNYNFVSDNDISRTASLGSRYSQSSLRGIILDMHFLSSTDYLVCTFSSQVCRVAYELMQTLHGDASAFFRSLDDSFYFGGQNAHNMRAVENHKASHHEELSMQVGDLLGIAGNHWDGFSQGTNRRTGQSGLYPSYKVVNDVVAVKMPLYVDVKEDNKEDRTMR